MLGYRLGEGPMQKGGIVQAKRVSLSKGLPCPELGVFLQRSLRRIMKKAGIPGMQMAIMKRGVAVGYSALGVSDMRTCQPLSKEAIGRGSSLSKFVFSVAIANAIKQGILDEDFLDTPLVDMVSPNCVTHFIGLKKSDGEPVLFSDCSYAFKARLGAVTARMILSHTAGFQDGRLGGQLSINFNPGSKWQISEEGVRWLGEAIVDILDTPLERFLDNCVLRPFGMVQSSFARENLASAAFMVPHDKHKQVLYGDSDSTLNVSTSLHTNARDYLLFMQAVARGSKHGGVYSQLFEKQMNTDSIEFAQPDGWGLGVGLMGETGLWQFGNGEGAQALMAMDRETGNGFVCLANSDNLLKVCQSLFVCVNKRMGLFLTPIRSGMLASFNRPGGPLSG